MHHWSSFCHEWSQCWHGKFYRVGKTVWVKLGKRVSFTHEYNWVKPIHVEILIYCDHKYSLIQFKVKQ